MARNIHGKPGKGKGAGQMAASRPQPAPAITIKGGKGGPVTIKPKRSRRMRPGEKSPTGNTRI